MEDTSARRPLLADRTQRDDGTWPRVRCRWVLLALVAALTTMVLITGARHATDTFWSRPRVAAEPIARHFATKTAYWDQRSRTEEPPQRASRFAVDAAETAHGLRLVQTQLVTRHGIRYPTLSPIEDLEALLRKLAPFETTLPAWLHDYRLQYNASLEGALAVTGADEMNQLAARLLTGHGHGATRVVYSEDTFQLSHTHVERTKDSAVAFSRRYFENPDDVNFIERPKHNDTLLRFFDICARYQREVKQNASALEQAHTFARSELMESSLKQLRDALNISATGVILTMRDLAAAFSACAFDVALYGIHDQWCSLFSSEMVTTLDYDDDLKAFYQLAGGYAINYEMAAVLLQDIVTMMDQRIAGASAVVGTFRFAHAETTLPLMTLLGYGSRLPLHASSTREQILSRGFRTSQLAPFAANIEFRLYERLAADDPTNADGSYVVQVLVNERSDIEIPGCGKVFCPLAMLKRLWWRSLYDYDFAQQCQLPSL